MIRAFRLIAWEARLGACLPAWTTGAIGKHLGRRNPSQ